jgi:hypothetical protein
MSCKDVERHAHMPINWACAVSAGCLPMPFVKFASPRRKLKFPQLKS